METNNENKNIDEELKKEGEKEVVDSEEKDMEKTSLGLEDDGTLACLGIQVIDPAAKVFPCESISALELINQKFWLLGFYSGISTKHGDNKYLVHIAFQDADGKPDMTKDRKFFTSSRDLIYVLEELQKIDKFPRLVTLVRNKKSYHFK